MTTSEKCSRERRTSKCRRLAAIGAWLIAALAYSSNDAAAQSLTLEYQQVITRAIPGATAAFALDPSRVGASAQSGQLTLVGRAPGATNVIVVIGDRTETLQVVVGEPPRIFLPGTLNFSGSNAESGNVEVRYGSDPGILQGNVRFVRREGDRTTELALGGATPFADATASPFSIPLASYTVRTPSREITLMDRVVANSPLTVSRSNVRGLHLQQGPWRAHAGYSFFGNFEHLLLPTNKESVAGIGYQYRLKPGSSLTPNIYYFDSASDSTRRGPLGTLLYEAQLRPDVRMSAEVAVSRAIGSAVEIEADNTNRRAWAKLRVAPSELPSLSADRMSGRQLEAGWIARGDALSMNANVSSRSYVQGAFGHTSNVGSVDVQRRLTPAWAIHGGTGYSLFQNASQPGSKVHSLTLPAGTTFSRRHFGLGADYQFSRETTRDLAGHLVRANLNGAAGGFRVSLNAERQTQAPTARQILTEVAWLQPMLDRLGLAAETPQQLAELLQTNAELSAFGYANSLTIDVTPMRTRAGASAGWSGSGMFAPQIFASTLINHDELIDRTSLSAIHSLSYSQRLGGSTEVFFTWSALCNSRVFASSSCRPSMNVSLRRTLSSAPGILTRRQGTIHGTVFQDDLGTGTYNPGLPTLPGVEVILDGVRSTRTDGSGWFRFDDVAYGRHRVEARYSSSQPTFFTTPSPADVETGGAVHFGVGLARSSIRGLVRTDAGIGLSGVVVRIAGGERQLSVSTTDNGAFIAEGLPAGTYDVTIDAGSVPAGYPVDALAPQRVLVEEAAPGRATFELRPYRSVSGRARLFNRTTGQYEPLAGATVELQPCCVPERRDGVPYKRQVVTDANGLYAFRDLPAGEFTVMATHDGHERVIAVTVPQGPASMKDVEVAVVPRGDVVPGIGPQRASVSSSREIAAHARNERSSTGAATFTIEIASSTNARHARAMVNELKDAGHAAYLVEPAASAHGGSYQVRVGRYLTLADADRSARTLERSLGWRLRVTTAVR